MSKKDDVDDDRICDSKRENNGTNKKKVIITNISTYASTTSGMITRSGRIVTTEKNEIMDSKSYLDEIRKVTEKSQEFSVENSVILTEERSSRILRRPSSPTDSGCDYDYYNYSDYSVTNSESQKSRERKQECLNMAVVVAVTGVDLGLGLDRGLGPDLGLGSDLGLGLNRGLGPDLGLGLGLEEGNKLHKNDRENGVEKYVEKYVERGVRKCEEKDVERGVVDGSKDGQRKNGGVCIDERGENGARAYITPPKLFSIHPKVHSF